MSRFLLLNFEDFGLNQDITKTIQPFNPFCMCCLDREGPMFNLDKCHHSDYLEAFDKPQLKQFKQLVCLQCHTMLKKIKCFQQQILYSYGILLSGAFTDATVNNKRLCSLMIQKVVDDLHLPPQKTLQLDPNIIDEDITNSIQESFNLEIQDSLQENFVHEVENDSNMEDDFAHELPSDSIIEENFTHELHNDSNIEENFTHELDNDSNIEESFSNNVSSASNIEENFTHQLHRDSNIEENLSHELTSDSNMQVNFIHKLQNVSNIEENFTHQLPNGSNIEENFTHELPSASHIEENFTNELPSDSNEEENFCQNVQTGSNLEESYAVKLPICTTMVENYTHHRNRLNIEENLTHTISDTPNIEENFTHNIEDSSNMEENLIHEQNRLHKNIKTALEILERNNQSFVTLGSQLQFLNGEHLSYLEPSLLSKEILTDIPLIPTENLTSDLDTGLLNTTKSLDIEIDGPEKMFYDTLDLSPDLIAKEATSDVIEIEVDAPVIRKEDESKKKIRTIKPKKKKERKVRTKKVLIQIKTVKLSQEELNRERVLQAQSDAYLRYKFRCETCIIGFNYKENLEDHTRRKHGPVVADNVTCDICYQVISTPGSVTEHNYRHYTRYECTQCNRRYHTHDEAIRHSVRNQCGGGTATSRVLKMNRMTKVKLKSQEK